GCPAVRPATASQAMEVPKGTGGEGVAVGRVELDPPEESAVLHDRSLYSAVASCSSGVELDQAQVVVVGNARGIGGRYRIGHGVMRDALDADGIWAAIRDAGLDLPDRPHHTDLPGRPANAFPPPPPPTPRPARPPPTP